MCCNRISRVFWHNKQTKISYVKSLDVNIRQWNVTKLFAVDTRVHDGPNEIQKNFFVSKNTQRDTIVYKLMNVKKRILEYPYIQWYLTVEVGVQKSKNTFELCENTQKSGSVNVIFSNCNF